MGRYVRRITLHRFNCAPERFRDIPRALTPSSREEKAEWTVCALTLCAELLCLQNQSQSRRTLVAVAVAVTVAVHCRRKHLDLLIEDIHKRNTEVDPFDSIGAVTAYEVGPTSLSFARAFILPLTRAGASPLSQQERSENTQKATNSLRQDSWDPPHVGVRVHWRLRL